MMINRFAVLACSMFLLASCSSLGKPGVFGISKKVVASEQSLSVNTVKKSTPAVPETRTLFIKSDANEKSVVLVAGIALKDSTSLSSYSVIVGSFSQPTSALALIDKLKQKTLSPFFVRNEKGMYRLVAGTFQDKDDADFLMLKLDVDDIDAWILERLVNPA